MYVVTNLVDAYDYTMLMSVLIMCAGCSSKCEAHRLTKFSAIDLLEKKFRKKAELKERELELKRMELELQARKLDAEEARIKMDEDERKLRLNMELEERKAMLEFLKKRFCHYLCYCYVYFTGSIQINNQAMN